MRDQVELYTRVHPGVKHTGRIIYIDLGQHGPCCEVESAGITHNGALHDHARHLVKCQRGGCAASDVTTPPAGDIDINPQLVHLRDRENRPSASAVTAGTLGRAGRNQGRALVHTDVSSPGADESPGVGKAPGDDSIEGCENARITDHCLQRMDRGLSLPVFEVADSATLLGNQPGVCPLYPPQALLCVLVIASMA